MKNLISGLAFLITAHTASAFFHPLPPSMPLQLLHTPSMQQIVFTHQAKLPSPGFSNPIKRSVFADQPSPTCMSLYRNGATSIFDYVSYTYTVCSNGDQFYTTDKESRLTEKPTGTRPPLTSIWMKKKIDKRLGAELTKYGIKAPIQNQNKLTSRISIYGNFSTTDAFCVADFAPSSTSVDMSFHLMCNDKNLNAKAAGISENVFESMLKERNLAGIVDFSVEDWGSFMLFKVQED